MTLTDPFVHDRSLNGNHTPACALTTRGGVCDCWPPTANAAPWGPLDQAAEGNPAKTSWKVLAVD